MGVSLATVMRQEVNDVERADAACTRAVTCRTADADADRERERKISPVRISDQEVYGAKVERRFRGVDRQRQGRAERKNRTLGTRAIRASDPIRVGLTLGCMPR
jgi:hypothetical protein